MLDRDGHVVVARIVNVDHLGRWRDIIFGQHPRVFGRFLAYSFQ